MVIWELIRADYSSNKLKFAIRSTNCSMQSAMIVQIVGAIKLMTVEFVEETVQTLAMDNACSIVSYTHFSGHKPSTGISLCRLRCSLQRYILVQLG